MRGVEYKGIQAVDGPIIIVKCTEKVFVSDTEQKISSVFTLTW